MTRWIAGLSVVSAVASTATLAVTVQVGAARDARIEVLEAEVLAARSAETGVEAPRAAESSLIQRSTGALTAADLSAIAELCAVAVRSAEPAAPVAAAAPAEVPVDPEVLAERAEADREIGELLDAASARGRWTEADRTALRELIGHLGQEELDRNLGRLMVMLNSGELEPEAVPPI